MTPSGPSDSDPEADAADVEYCLANVTSDARAEQPAEERRLRELLTARLEALPITRASASGSISNDRGTRGEVRTATASGAGIERTRQPVCGGSNRLGNRGESRGCIITTTEDSCIPNL